MRRRKEKTRLKSEDEGEVEDEKSCWDDDGRDGMYHKGRRDNVDGEVFVGERDDGQMVVSRGREGGGEEEGRRRGWGK